MWSQIKKALGPTPTEPQTVDKVMACAVLLYEIAQADFAQQPAEIAALRSGLIETFGVAEGEVESLLQDAEARQQSAISLHDFVDSVNRQMSPEEKPQLMTLLWRVAYADGHLDPNEEHRLRKIADLLYIPHAEFIRTKLAVAEKLER